MVAGPSVRTARWDAVRDSWSPVCTAPDGAPELFRGCERCAAAPSSSDVTQPLLGPIRLDRQVRGDGDRPFVAAPVGPSDGNDLVLELDRGPDRTPQRPATARLQSGVTPRTGNA